MENIKLSEKQLDMRLRKKNHKKSTSKKGLWAKLVISFSNTRYGMVKDSKMRGYMMPLSPQDQGKHSAKISKNPKEWGLSEDYTTAHCVELLQKSIPQYLSEAFCALCQVGKLLPSPTAAWVVLLIAMLARVLDLTMPNLPNVPVIRIKNVSDVPQSLKMLLQIINGVDVVRKGDGWKLSRPSVLVPLLDRKYNTLSSHPADYVGGTYKNDNSEKTHFWIPLDNCAAAVQTGIPKDVFVVLFEQWTTAVPIICGDGFKIKDRPVIVLDGQDFLTIDPEILDQLVQHTERIFAELDYIFFCLHDKPKWWHRCAASIETYLPTVRHGRFVQTIATPEVKILATALVVFREILDRAEEEAWVSVEDADTVFIEAWRAVLPESAPKIPVLQPEENSLFPVSINGLTYDSPELFYSFLGDIFLPSHNNQIALPGEAVTDRTDGKLHYLEDGLYFITPRTKFLLEYKDFLIKSNVAPFSTQDKDWENPVLAALIANNVPLKKEGNGSWRYPTFYDKEYRTPATKNIKYIGLPVNLLPPEVENTISEQTGIEIGTIILPNQMLSDSN